MGETQRLGLSRGKVVIRGRAFTCEYMSILCYYVLAISCGVVHPPYSPRKVLRRYSDKTVAQDLVQELESYGGDPSNIMLSGTCLQATEFLVYR